MVAVVATVVVVGVTVVLVTVDGVGDAEEFGLLV